VPNVTNEKKLPMHSSKPLNVFVDDLQPEERRQQRDLSRQSESSLRRGFVSAIAFAPDGQSVATLLAGGVAIWTQEGVRVLHRNASPKDTRLQSNLGYSPDSNRLNWDADEQCLSIAELNSTELRVQTLEQPGPGDSFAWAPSGRRFAVGGTYSKILEVELATMKITPIVDNGVYTSCLAYNGEDQIFAGHPDGSIQAWDRNSGTSTRIKVHSGEVRHILLQDQGRIGISVDVSGNVGVWFAKEPEALGLITQDFQTLYNGVSMPPKLWTDSKSVIRLLYNDVYGGVSIKQWELEE
jgi:WD40 repeat protein